MHQVNTSLAVTLDNVFRRFDCLPSKEQFMIECPGDQPILLSWKEDAAKAIITHLGNSRVQQVVGFKFFVETINSSRPIMTKEPLDIANETIIGGIRILQTNQIGAVNSNTAEIQVF